MSGTSKVEGCLVRELVAWEPLTRALSEVLDLTPADIRAFDGEGMKEPRPAVLVESHVRASGFRMDLTLYLGSEVQVGLTGVFLARRLAMELGQEILTSPPVEADGTSYAPDLWMLARPDGSLFLVRQLNPESDDVEVDLAHMQHLPLPLP
jgi:hypothetical protein